MSSHHPQRKLQSIKKDIRSPLPPSANLQDSNLVSATPNGSPHFPYLLINFPPISSPPLSTNKSYMAYEVYIKLPLFVEPSLPSGRTNKTFL